MGSEKVVRIILYIIYGYIGIYIYIYIWLMAILGYMWGLGRWLGL